MNTFGRRRDVPSKLLTSVNVDSTSKTANKVAISVSSAKKSLMLFVPK